MSDQIKQPGNVPLVTPLNRTRDPGARKGPPKRPPKPSAGGRRRSPPEDKSHRVDEYV